MTLRRAGDGNQLNIWRKAEMSGEGGVDGGAEEGKSGGKKHR